MPNRGHRLHAFRRHTALFGRRKPLPIRVGWPLQSKPGDHEPESSLGRQGFPVRILLPEFCRQYTAGVNSFPSNSYDLALNYGRAAFATRSRLFLGGSFALPEGFRLSPFMMANSGSPFNITTGQDNNGDSIFNDRPAYAPAGAAGTNIVKTQWGTFDTNPQAGETIIPVNLGT